MEDTIYDQEYAATLEVKASPIHGVGVFAKTAITSGDLILSSFGANAFEIIGHPTASITEATDLPIYLTSIYSRASSAPHPAEHCKSYMPRNEFRFINHDLSNSNVKVLDNLKTYATQDIEVGEELTLNYNDVGYYD